MFLLKRQDNLNDKGVKAVKFVLGGLKGCRPWICNFLNPLILSKHHQCATDSIILDAI